MAVDWLLLGAIVALLIMLVLGIGAYYGARYRTGFREAYPPISVLYLKASERRITKFIYFLVTFEAPPLCIFLAGYLLAPSELIDFLFGSPSPSIHSFLLSITAGFAIACSIMMANEFKDEEQEA